MFRVTGSIMLGMLLVCLPLLTYADGGVFITEKIVEIGQPAQSAQQAIIVWDNGIETLHLQSNYSGPAEDFVWVIPVPARPSVERSSWQLFQETEEITRPQVKIIRRTGTGCCCLMCGCAASSGGDHDFPVDMGVTKLESLDIRELHVDILAAADGGGLIRWLHTNGYAVPQNAGPVLQEYIGNGFFFVAVKMNRESLQAFAKGTRWAIEVGLTPLAVTFETDQPFFPLKISSLSSAPENEILLLTIAPYRVTPVEYSTVELSKDDVKRGLGPALLAASTENYGVNLGPRRPDWEENPRQYVSNTKNTGLDFGPAIKEAQKQADIVEARRGASLLVVEAGVPVIYDNAGYLKHAEYTFFYLAGWFSGQEMDRAARKRVKENLIAALNIVIAEDSNDKVMWVTRFHAFLSPETMRDITFVPDEREEICFSEFSFYAYELEAYIPMSLAWAGFGFTIFPRRRPHSRFRKFGFVLFLLALCVGC